MDTITDCKEYDAVNSKSKGSEYKCELVVISSST